MAERRRNEKLPDALRIQAFELFMSADEKGRRMTLRGISQRLGIHENTLRGWAKADEWKEKLRRHLEKAATWTQASNAELKTKMRLALNMGIDELHNIISSGEKDADRINAVKALAEIAIKADALSQQTNPGGSVGEAHDFKDDIAEATQDGSVDGPERPPEEGAAPAADQQQPDDGGSP